MSKPSTDTAQWRRLRDEYAERYAHELALLNTASTIEANKKSYTQWYQRPQVVTILDKVFDWLFIQWTRAAQRNLNNTEKVADYSHWVATHSTYIARENAVAVFNSQPTPDTYSLYCKFYKDKK